MFCRSDSQSLAAETRPPPPQSLAMEMATTNGGGGGGGGFHVPVSISAPFHIYMNGNNSDPNAAASPPENCLNPINPLNRQNPNPSPQNPVYMECQRNHAANMGGHAVDGCGEFMADEEDALKCAVCGCHRNFHRRETGEESPPPCDFCAIRRKRLFGGGGASSSSPGSPSPSPSPSASALLPYYGSIQPHLLADSDDPDNNNNNSNYSQRGGMQKRFRTKFSQEQKGKMYLFAEKVGWKMQKQDEVAVQQFCNEIGVEKGVLKVWMHNNKHTLGKKP